MRPLLGTDKGVHVGLRSFVFVCISHFTLFLLDITFGMMRNESEVKKFNAPIYSSLQSSLTELYFENIIFFSSLHNSLFLFTKAE
jgi:hypothetical protein